ncbi:uncharacterized protein MONOS_16341 [Monocercomonoides exilis]|uniref:uncharacterized protein n=1 Tax=Monocercomonoides exilis TaxID=2049356 RepID=UPI00355A3322|nr:hypothetical protein MONOS_16341 [Monocercomonoides exilis]|eukprot:MONOS_16341.1-p1 / transcript=MONOS_16341.1 / gene=MONOS_16341 / organism=Monocercomonoides_exilis_PA203 / gene_product=unspecified product / transcript_product=unspecified product / location=Mono_scaffold01662:1779-2918(-) / protein_length=364 / sequence_SO=supercontig / SO=protein_coding / is_pseudo=false
MDRTGKEEEETKDEGLSSTPREAEFCEVTTPISELVDDANAIHAETGNRPRGMEGDGPASEQTKESEEKEQTSSTNNGRLRAGMGCNINNNEGEQRGEDICPRELDPPGECVSDKRKGVLSSVEDTRDKGSMAATTEDRSYSSEDRQHVHEMDDSEEKGSAIAHSNTESIREETEQPGHNNTNGTPPGRTEHGSRCTQPDGKKAGLCTEGEESRRDSTNNRTENTRYNFRTDCSGALRKDLETILREKEEREREMRENEIVLVHPFLRNIGRTLKEKMKEAQRELTILILPAWRWQTWTPLLQPGHLIKTLGTFQECMIQGARMRREGWKLPPGEVICVTLEKRIYKEGTSSKHWENKWEKKT